jgi:L-arabinokinase
MDQMTATCGQTDRLLALLCQPAEFQKMISMPAELAYWGLDSGVRHAVTGADYASVRVGAFMGYRIIADLAGMQVTATVPGARVQIEDHRWGGFLSNITPTEFLESYVGKLPERMNGAEFLARYKGTSDPVTTINPETEYAVRIPAAHAIFENYRVRLYAELLSGPIGDQQLELLGGLMYQSHESYSACGLQSEGTDLLVRLVREAGTEQGLYGAKITGGGSGGTIAILGRHNSGRAVMSVAESYASKTGHQPYIFAGSSPGSADFGYLKLSPA